MKKIILALALLAASAPANALDLFVGPDGNDTNNDCRTQATPCRTGQYAVDQAPMGVAYTYDIYFADGDYYGPIKCTYWRYIALHGDQKIGADAVKFHATADSQTLIEVQDGCILIVSDLTLDSGGFSNITGILSRQLSIVDFGRVNFNAMPGGIHVSAEYAGMNASDYYHVNGSASVHVAANNNSRINLAGNIIVSYPSAFTVFAQVGHQSTLIIGGNVLGSGAGINTTGISWTSQDGSCVGCRNRLPGDQNGQIYGSGTAN